MERKLRAILSADVKGYSILMANDDTSTVETLKSYRGIMSKMVKQKSGRVVDAVGDNMLAEFESAVNAVKCAVDIQKELKVRNYDLPDDKKLEFRIGINIGDIVKDGDSIYGDGVNITARIEGLAESGGICISRNVYDQVYKKLNYNYEDIGGHSVKNISGPVWVYRIILEDKIKNEFKAPNTIFSTTKKILLITATTILLAIGIITVLYWKYFYLPTPENIDPDNMMTYDLPKGPSIAILPLNNMTGNPEQDFFCDGITENLTSALSRIPKLFVIDRYSSFQYKGKPTDPQQIGQELKVQFLLTGVFQRSNDRIRISVRLLETKSGKCIWSNTYDRQIDEIFNMQDEITLSIIKEIRVEIVEGEQIQGFQDQFTNIQDYFNFLKVLQYFNSFSPENNKLAQKKLLEIIESNPNLPPAYSFLAQTYILDLFMGLCDTPIFCFAKATEATRKALALDDKDRATLNAAANLFLMRKEHKKAIDQAKKNVAYNPNCGDCYALLGWVLTLSGQPEEAISFIKKGILLNPLPYHWYYMFLGASYTDIGEYNKAVEAFNESIKIEPSWTTYVNLVRTYVFMGMDNEAKESVFKLLQVRPNFSIKEFLDILPYKNEDVIAAYKVALNKADLPE